MEKIFIKVRSIKDIIISITARNQVRQIEHEIDSISKIK